MSEDNHSAETKGDGFDDYQFQLASLEYKEVCQNVREGWNYITTLFRQFLIIQILLISLVGLGGPAITNINSIIGGLTSLKATETQVSADTGRAIDPNGSSEFSARVAKFDIYAKNSSIFALVLVGFGLSWGAFIQSKRLFINCKKFVKRAAAIEVKFSLGTLSLDGDKDILPVNQYMNNRLSDPEQDDFQMQTALSIVYLSGCALWFFIGGILIVPFVA